MRYVNSRFKSRERGFNVFMIYILLTVSSNFFKAVSISTACYVKIFSLMWPVLTSLWS
jgi:hypothetical protein